MLVTCGGQGWMRVGTPTAPSPSSRTHVHEPEDVVTERRTSPAVSVAPARSPSAEPLSAPPAPDSADDDPRDTDQDELRSVVRQFFADTSPIGHVREVMA